MPKHTNETLSICIIASNNTPVKDSSILIAKILSSHVILLSLKTNDSLRRLSERTNVKLVTGNSIDDLMASAEVQQDGWFLCIRSNELIKHSTADPFSSLKKDKKQQIFGVYVCEHEDEKDFENFTFIRNLGQFDKINEDAGVIRIEPRLTRKDFLGEIIDSLMADKPFSVPYSKIIHGLQLYPDFQEKDNSVTQNPKDHDLLCLKGEKMYGSIKEDQIDELNPGYIGFRVVNMGYLDGYMEIAKRGWGTQSMYSSMLSFLNGNGNYAVSKELFDLWMKNGQGDKSPDSYALGGAIYANLFLFDQAQQFYEDAIKLLPDPAYFESMGKINIILGNRQKAIECLQAALLLRPYKLTKQILTMIENEKWRPLKMSACIISLNEEKTIAETLSSLEHIADEIIVVDTGSQDNTVKIAKEFGCKTFSMPWDDDFSLARNRAIAEATSDYILMIDADEFIHSRDRLGLLFTKSLLSPNFDLAYRVQFKDREHSQTLSISIMNLFLNKESYQLQTRLFPRRSDIRYSGFVFESVEPALEAAKIDLSPAPFFQITKQNTDMLLRTERKTAAVKKEFSMLKESAAALDCMLFFLKNGNWTEALECFNKTKDVDPLLAANIVNYFASNDKLEEAKSIAIKSLSDTPDSFELNMALAAVYFKDERYTSIHNTLFPFFQERSVKIPGASKGDFLFYLGISALEKNLIAESIEYIAQALETNLLDTRYQIAGLYAFAKSDNWEQFIGAAGQIVNQEIIDIDFEIKDFSDLGRLIFKFIQYFSRKNRNEETALLRKIMAHMIFSKFINNEEIDHMSQLINEQAQSSFIPVRS
ncbi:MAG: glycosyltransferase [Smithellaceae bacterium]